MHRLLIVLGPFLILALAVSACDDDGESTTPSTVTPTLDPETTPTEVSDLTSTLPHVIPPRDVGEFLVQYADKEIIQQPCTFDAAAGEVDCGDHGLYEPAPVPANENTDCTVLLVDDEPIAVRCDMQDPLTVIYYAVR